MRTASHRTNNRTKDMELAPLNPKEAITLAIEWYDGLDDKDQDFLAKIPEPDLQRDEETRKYYMHLVQNPAAKTGDHLVIFAFLKALKNSTLVPVDLKKQIDDRIANKNQNSKRDSKPQYSATAPLRTTDQGTKASHFTDNIRVDTLDDHQTYGKIKKDDDNCNPGSSGPSDCTSLICILCCVAFGAIAVAIGKSLSYAVRKTLSSLVNIGHCIGDAYHGRTGDDKKGKNPLRSLWKLVGAGGGLCATLLVTAKSGALLGAAIGTAIFPGLGTVAGLVLGAILGATAGLIITKYSAKLAAYARYGDTNPDRWRLTQAQKINLAKKDMRDPSDAHALQVNPRFSPGVSPYSSSVSIKVALSILSAIDAAKKKNRPFFHNSHASANITELNQLAKNIKAGNYTLKINQDGNREEAEIVMTHSNARIALQKLKKGAIHNRIYVSFFDLNDNRAKKANANNLDDISVRENQSRRLSSPGAA